MRLVHEGIDDRLSQTLTPKGRIHNHASKQSTLGQGLNHACRHHLAVRPDHQEVLDQRSHPFDREPGIPKQGLNPRKIVRNRSFRMHISFRKGPLGPP